MGGRSEAEARQRSNYMYHFLYRTSTGKQAFRSIYLNIILGYHSIHSTYKSICRVLMIKLGSRHPLV